MSSKLITQEAVMGHPIPKQHPEVVLRAHFKAVRALLAVAIVAVIALAATVVIVANDDDQATIAQPSTQAQQQTLPPGTRFDGGPDEGTRGPNAGVLPEGTRFDGGPDEGTRGPQSYWEQTDARSSYQPAPDDGFKDRAGGPRMIPQGPAAR
jgi:hypothetical protein